MTSFNIARTEENIKRELSNILKHVKDYRAKHEMVSIIKVSLAKDFSRAKIYVSSLEGAKATEEVIKGLNNAAGYIRQELNSKVQMRRSPELVFIADMSAEYSIEVNQKLNSLLHEDKNI